MSEGHFSMILYPIDGAESTSIDINLPVASFKLSNISLMKYDNHHHNNNHNNEEQQYNESKVKEFDRSCWCTILGLPFEISLKKLEEFLEPFLPEIVSYCILIVETDYDAGNEINIPKPDRCVLLHFVNSDVLTLFIQLYNNLQFSPQQLINAPCIVIPLSSIHIFGQIYSSIGTGEYTEINEMIPFPSCTVCIRRLRSDTSRIQGIKDITVSMKYFGNEDRCKVCATYALSVNRQNEGSTNASLSCMDCPVMHNIWTCLICSHRGCGRYTSRHAQIHSEQTGHSFSLELATGRIWDYTQDTFVHEEGFNFNDDIFGRDNSSSNVDSDNAASQKSNLLNPSIANDGPESNLDPVVVDKLSIIHIEFESLLEAQLAEQQLYFEKQYAQETWKAIAQKTSPSPDTTSSKVIPFATEGQLDVLEAMKIEISSIEAGHQDILNAMKGVQQEIRLLKKSNDALIREQKAMKEHVKQLNIREEEVIRERNERVADLRQQIIDLTVYMDTQDKIQNSPLRDEIITGTIQMVQSGASSNEKKNSSSNNNDNRKKKK